jgi:hypothetical protein
MADQTAVNMLPADAADASKMQPFSPDPNSPWWESFVRFGGTRVIDNTYGGQPNVLGNTSPGSFAGANGASYTPVPNGAGGGAVRSTATGGGSAANSGGSPRSWMPLALVALVAFAIWKK